MYFIDRNQISETLTHMEELLALYEKENEWAERFNSFTCT